MRLLLGVPVDQLGPIGKLLRGRRLHDVELVPGGMLIRCTDCLELDVQWGSDGAQLRGARILPGLNTELALAPCFQYVRGKLLDCGFTHRNLFLIAMQDGHILRCDWKDTAARPIAVDVQVPIILPAAYGQAGSMNRVH
jgi:hypothetical protein